LEGVKALRKIINQTKENMIALDIYKPEFDTTISIYAGLVEQYQAIEKEFKKSKFTVVEKTGYSDNAKKSPMVASLESLRKDILAYSNALGLTPAGLKKIQEKSMKSTKPKSKLETALMNFGT
jgi:phage terminase small subunit